MLVLLVKGLTILKSVKSLDKMYSVHKVIFGYDAENTEPMTRAKALRLPGWRSVPPGCKPYYVHTEYNDEQIIISEHCGLSAKSTEEPAFSTFPSGSWKTHLIVREKWRATSEENNE